MSAAEEWGVPLEHMMSSRRVGRALRKRRRSHMTEAEPSDVHGLLVLVQSNS